MRNIRVIQARAVMGGKTKAQCPTNVQGMTKAQ
jgi:hypothetical protein